MIEIFNKIDENSDGFITNKEFCNSLKDKKMNSKKLAAIFEGLDFDRNGRITYTEFISALISKEIYLNEHKLRQAFKLFDQDGDGEITFTELRNIIGKECNVKFTDQYWKNLVKAVDTNGDGCIDFDEFFRMLK